MGEVGHPLLNIVTNEAVVVLDGASAFVPVPVPAATYADHLGRYLSSMLEATPDVDLTATLSAAIRSTAEQLRLRPGQSPSSTVAILRRKGSLVDLLALGDSVIVLPGEVITDDRIDQLALAARQQYRARLAAGHGYDDTHSDLLRELQPNRPNAETSPMATGSRRRYPRPPPTPSPSHVPSMTRRGQC
jgi:hypothetical protein